MNNLIQEQVLYIIKKHKTECIRNKLSEIKVIISENKVTSDCLFTINLQLNETLKQINGGKNYV